LATGKLRTIRRAKRLVVKVLIVLELYIMDPETEPYKMGWAWWKALKFWIAARFSDHF
jgi:hypothetical protein